MTKQLRSAAQKLREQARDDWEAAGFAELTSQDWAVRNAIALGQSRGWRWFQEMDFMSFVNATEDSGE